MKIHGRLMLAAILVIPSAYSNAALVAYTDQASFLSDLAALGTVVHEGFEGSAWDGVRSSISGGFATAPNVSSRGVTWASSNPAGGVTTGSGPALNGNWGFYAYPHGSYSIGNMDCADPVSIPGVCGDGFHGSADNGVLYGAGGWIETNTPFAKLAMFIGAYDPEKYDPDTGSFSNEVDFGETCDSSGENCTANAIIGTQHKFFGVIDSDGFSQFEYRELEGTNADQKLIFADDFYLAGTDIAAVPLPSAVWLFGSGLFGLFRIAIHRKAT